MEVVLHQNLKYAYLGDAYYELEIRKYIYNAHPEYSMEILHTEDTYYARCKTQNNIIKEMLDDNFLTENEAQIFKQARNEKTSSHPKNYTVNEYRNATGFEAVIGYHVANKNYDRADEIIKHAIKIADKLKNDK